MALTSPNTTPAQYSAASVSRYGTLLSSGLNIVNVHAMNKFIELYGFTPYALVNELAGNIEKSENKQIKWYQSHGRYMGFVTASATVAVAAGAPATVTVGLGSYSLSGAASLPTAGLVFYNSRTGIEGKVSAPNKATPYAHTFVLTPVNIGENISVVAGDELLNRGQKYLGEQSTKTETIIRNIDLYSNYNTELRKDSTLTDLAMAERIEFEFEGQHYFTLKQKRDDDISLMWERELLIMESTQTNNVGNEEGSNGVIKQVEANGINGTFGSFGVQTTLAAIDRALSSVGAPYEYDILADKIATQNIQNSFFNTVNNGAIIYNQSVSRNGIDLNLNFKSVTAYNRKWNFQNYQLFDEATVYGSAGLGLRSNFMLLIPVGTSPDARDAMGKVVKAPRFTVTYQDPMGGNMKWRTANTGLFADPPTSTTAESVYTTIGYWGVVVRGASQYLIMKGSG